MKIKKLTLKDKAMPEALTRLAQPPRELFALGELEALLTMPAVAVVGSRKVSPYGRAVAANLTADLARQGILIVSGLALGVDSIAHLAALDAGGKTIAILPSGLGKIYPASHAQLAKRILEAGGALMSEYPLDMPPEKHHFIARNRLISGLSLGVLIIEAAEKSGTLHTANFALEQGKTVFAVPGNITSQLSKGTNNLIKAGATPVTQADDVLNALGLETKTPQYDAAVAATAEEAALLELLGQGITDSSQLQAQCKFSTATFNQTLTMLEITGKIRSLGAGHWRLS